MTRLISNWVSPIVAATKAVKAPTIVTTSSANGDCSNKGEQRASMKTPAVTIVAAWMRAETGVGPSIASGSQVCRPSWADLPIAPTNSSRQQVDSASAWVPRKVKCIPTLDAAAAKTGSNCTESKMKYTAMMPSEKPKSPTRLTTKALIAAFCGAGLSYQKPTSRYEARQTPSQPTNTW